jgi:hypothetical protein
VDLGIADLSLNADMFVIDWTSRAQDGTIQTSVVPGTMSYQGKRGLQLNYDESTGKLVLVWIEEISAFSHVRVGVLHDGLWTNSALQPTQGISRAHNPQVRLTHQTVSWLDDKDSTVSATTSILSVIWWEESNVVEARLATLFRTKAGAPGSLSLYELPVPIGSSNDSERRRHSSGHTCSPASRRTASREPCWRAMTSTTSSTRWSASSFRATGASNAETGNLKWKRWHALIVSTP